MRYPPPLTHLIHLLRRLPGLGPRSAERLSFYFLSSLPGDVKQLGEALLHFHERLTTCDLCGCVVEKGKTCALCDPQLRETHRLCVLASSKEVFSFESIGSYRGLYHVLGGTLSPLEKRGPDQLSIDRLRERVLTHKVEELIIALDATLEGDATALYLKQEFENYPLQISRLAFGLPVGSALEQIDGHTLAQAFLGRRLI